MTNDSAKIQKGTRELTSMRFPSPDPRRLQMMAADLKTRKVSRHANNACGVCGAAHGARWTSPNSSTVGAMNSSANNACVVCEGSLNPGSTFADASKSAAADAYDEDLSDA